LVNSNHATILGQKAFSKIGDLPESVDLAVIATPAATVPEIVAECAAVGVKGAVIIEALKSGQIGYLGLDVYEQEEEIFFEDRSGLILSDHVFARLLTFQT